MAREGGVSENARHELGLDFAQQRFLRRGITLRVNVSTRRDDAPEGALCSGKVAPIVKVKGVKVRPEEAAQIAAGGETGHICRRSVLSSTPGTQTTCRYAKRRQAPVIVREGAPNQMTESRANITIGSVETPGMSIRRDSATGKENLGPTRARAKQTEGSLCVRKLTNGGQEGPSLTNAPAKQILTPLRRPKRSAEKFEIGGSNPGTTRKITRGERLGGRSTQE